ncbi:MAG TPA: hypothetical protein IAA37_02855 [Candidatus Eubacterium faecale]|uniref:Uncharacterized protein n=1 Tax=Candidatus Eubacterium faecale TaxID=2838568 RepID=A0A9D2MH41_9FIRM|nr:hypothetical protein [Candidatus Eubacterium faecale]
MEWTVVGVIVVIVGLIGTVAVPLAKNTKAMTQLSERINHLVFRMEREESALGELKLKTAEKHKLLFERLSEHQKTIIEHESRIYALERKEDRNEGMDEK